MKVKPVSHYKTPDYPDIKKAQLNPDLLKKLPKRWQNNRAVLTAVSALAAISLTSCNVARYTSENSDGTVAFIGSSAVAPIFEHGKGTGSLGCVMVAPPAFMSEEEALSIIKNEAMLAGVDLNDTPTKYTVEPHSYRKGKDLFSKYKLGSDVSLEASDEDKGIAVSFISKEEAELTTKDGGPYSTVTEFLMKERAEKAALDWAEEEIPYKVGTFYDPGLDFARILEIQKEIFGDSYNYSEEKQKQYDEAIKTELENELRAQVRDFIEWLRGQGII